MTLSGKTKQEVLTEFRCAEILDAARHVFAEKGFTEATVDAIAEAAGVSKGTVYLYFPSKREIYLAALMKGVQEMVELTWKEVEAAAGSRARIAAFIGTRLGYFERHREFFRIYHCEFGAIVQPAALRTEFKSLYLQQLKALERVVDEGIKAGEIRPARAATLAAAIFEMTRGVTLARLLGNSEEPVASEAEELTEMVWRGIATS